MVSYNLNIPDGPNNPSNDQPLMKINTNAIQTLISVDHVGFNTSGSAPNGVGGHHLQVSFDGKNPPAAQTDPQSVLYTNSGTASTISSMFYSNQNGIFQISSLRAWAYCDNTGAILGSQSSNVASVVLVPGTPVSFNVTLTANAVTTNSFAVFVSMETTGLLIPTYSITGVGTFTLIFTRISGPITTPTTFTFEVLQI